MYKSPLLDNIRQKIDGLDNQIHDLLMERADLIMAISEEKKRQNIQIVQPGREARMIRRLMERHRGPLPQETIAHIWRELVSSVSLLQTGLSVAVYFTPEHPKYWDMARDYFGSVLPMTRTDSVEDALRQAQQGEVTFAVVPFPDTPQNATWIDNCATHDQDGKKISIIQRLPFGLREGTGDSKNIAAIVSQSSFGASDDDHTLLLVQADQKIDHSLLDQTLAKQNLKMASAMDIPSSTHILVDVAGYIDAENPVLKLMATQLNVAIEPIGGYPTSITYKQY